MMSPNNKKDLTTRLVHASLGLGISGVCIGSTFLGLLVLVEVISWVPMQVYQ